MRVFPFLVASRWGQVGVLFAFWLAGEAVVRVLGVPLSGAVVGLALLLAALGSGRLRVEAVQRGADLLLADMLLFFVPAALAVVDHGELLGLTGLKILFLIGLSTTLVMATTAWTVQQCLRWKR